MRHLTAREFQKAARCLQIDDIVYLPPPMPLQGFQRAGMKLLRCSAYPPTMEEAAQKVLAGRLDARVFYLHVRSHFSHAAYLCGGIASYTAQPDGAWFACVPPSLQADMEREAYATTVLEDPLISTIPYTGISYVVEMNTGVCKDVLTAFNLSRLARIRQLGNLRHPAGRASPVGWRFHHSRLTHVLDVMAIATLIAVNNRLSEHERISLRVAALIHDALTPAHGDSTKLIDPPAFDEDANIGELLEGPRSDALLRKYALDRELLIQTVQGRGKLGVLLDIADKIAYVSGDLRHYLGAPTMVLVDPHLRDEAWSGLIPIRNLLLTHPAVTSVWDCVRVHEEQVFFRDTQRLFDFLHLRTLLFRHLYYHPMARFQEFVFGQVALHCLYAQGKISRSDLLRMNDDELDSIISRFCGLTETMPFGKIEQLGEPKIETFMTVAEANARAKELQRDEAVITFIENLSSLIKTGLHFLTQSPKENTLRPLREAAPAGAEVLEELARFARPVRLYCLSRPRVSPAFIKAYKAHVNSKAAT